MRITLRRVLNFFLFGPSRSSRLPPLTPDQTFMLNQYRMGLISEGDWHDALDHDPNLAAHFRFHHPDKHVERIKEEENS